MSVTEHRDSSALKRVVELLDQLPTEWMQLGWSAQREPLERLAQQALGDRSTDEGPQRLVALALLLWLAGLPERGDDLLLELDGRRPELGVVPDHWGLWSGSAQQSAQAAVLATALDWRHGDQSAAEAALNLWRERVAGALEQGSGEGWRRLLEPQALILLALALTPAGAGDRWRGDLEPPLVQAVGESVVEQHPQEALLFWSGISQRCPSWDYARLKSADLSLQSGQLQRSATVLAGATQEQRSNPWLHDIAARLAMAQNNPAEALRCWDGAISAAAGNAELVELLRQRRREAEWEAELSGVAPITGLSGEEELDRFAARLEELAQRYGVTLPLGMAPDATADPEAFGSFLDQAGGRLALAG